MQIFHDEDNLEKFKQLLSILYLYDIAQFDYEQTIEDSDDFNNVDFVNGIGFKKIDNDNFMILKPINSRYVCEVNQYVQINHLLIPPSILAANNYTDKKEHYNIDIIPEVFLLKLEQLTGNNSLINAPVVKKEFNGKINSNILGKWYRISKIDSFIPMLNVEINWFKKDGILMKSVVFLQNINEKPSENWSPKIVRGLLTEIIHVL